MLVTIGALVDSNRAILSSIGAIHGSIGANGVSNGAVVGLLDAIEVQLGAVVRSPSNFVDSKMSAAGSIGATVASSGAMPHAPMRFAVLDSAIDAIVGAKLGSSPPFDAHQGVVGVTSVAIERFDGAILAPILPLLLPVEPSHTARCRYASEPTSPLVRATEGVTARRSFA
jgi:hypothetical protein